MRELRGKNLIVLGHFEEMTRGMVSRYLQILGARLRPRLDPETELVVAGQRAGESLSQARQRALPILREAELLEALGLQPESGETQARLVNQAWDRIEAWLVSHADPLARSLPGPASEAEIAALEEALGRALPLAVKESYHRHNGAALLIGGAGWLSAGEALSTLRWMCEETQRSAVDAHAADFRVKALLWSPKWLPIWSNGQGHHQAVDWDPEPAGRMDQVLDCRSEPLSREVNADGFALWLNSFAHDLERGSYAFNGRAIVASEEGLSE